MLTSGCRVSGGMHQTRKIFDRHAFLPRMLSGKALEERPHSGVADGLLQHVEHQGHAIRAFVLLLKYPLRKFKPHDTPWIPHPEPLGNQRRCRFRIAELSALSPQNGRALLSSPKTVRS